MTKPAVLFIAVCEFLMGLMLAFFCIVFLFVSRTDANDGWRTIAGAMICGLGTLLCFLIGYAMLRRRRWGWYASWVVGVITVALGCFLVWAASRPEDDGREAIFLAFPILACALPACWIMLTSSRQGFVVGTDV